MRGELRREQRHCDVAGLDRGEEADDVVDALRSQYRHPITPGGHLLQARTDRPHPGAQLGRGQVDGLTVGMLGVVEVAVSDGIADVGDVAVQKRHQVDAFWQDDAAIRIEVVGQLQPVSATATFVTRGTSHEGILREGGVFYCR
jgi:hypothetical protein